MPSLSCCNLRRPDTFNHQLDLIHTSSLICRAPIKGDKYTERTTVTTAISFHVEDSGSKDMPTSVTSGIDDAENLRAALVVLAGYQEQVLQGSDCIQDNGTVLKPFFTHTSHCHNGWALLCLSDIITRSQGEAGSSASSPDTREYSPRLRL